VIRLIVICCRVMAILLTGLSSTSAVAAAVGLERVASGLDRPVYVTHAPGDQERLFIVEKTGTIKILNLTIGTINATPFLTVPDTDDSGNEEGLLGLAFHPEYADNGKFYVNVTVDDDGGTAATRTHVRQYLVSGNPDVADTTPTEVLVFNQPQENHNGGWMGFGPNDVQRFQCMRYCSFRQHIGERQLAVLQELPLQKTHLLAKPSMIRKRHREASLPVMGV
jgi:hypothetical protein